MVRSRLAVWLVVASVLVSCSLSASNSSATRPTAVPTPVQTLDASATPSPRPVATDTPVPEEPTATICWRPLISGHDAGPSKPGVVHATWSPTDDRLLVDLDVTNGSRSDQSVAEVTADGTIVAKYDGFAHGEWLDGDRIVLFSDTRNSTETADVEFRTSDGDALPGADAFPQLDSADVMSSGHGALVNFGSSFRPFRYRVWTPDAVTAIQDGYPVAWSPNGQNLAVLHVTKSGPGVSGWLEVVSWPDLGQVYADKTTTVSDQFELDVAFSPTSRHLAYLGDEGIVAVDLASGDRNAWSKTSPWGLFAWTADDNLVVADARTRKVATYEADGRQVDAIDVSADHVVASSDGSHLVAYVPSDIPPPVLAVIAGGALRLIDLPGQLLDPPAFSPGGMYITAVSDADHVPTVLIAGP